MACELFKVEPGWYGGPGGDRRLGIYSVELVPRLPVQRLRGLAEMVEELGFHGVWLSEHPHNRSSIVAASHLLESLRRIWVGAGLFNPYLHKPPLVAQVAATLSEVAPGRVRVLVGAGDGLTLESMGVVRERPLERVGEMLAAVKALLERGVYEHGKAGLRLDFRPGEPPPIYVGAQGRGMLRLGARLGDGVLVNYSRVEELRWALQVVGEELGKRGRPWEGFDAAAFLTISIDDDPSRALRSALPYAAYILLGSGRSFRERYGVREGDLQAIRDAVLRRDWRRLQDLMPRYVEYVAITGTPKQVSERVAEIRSLGYRHIVFGAPLGPDTGKALRMLGAMVGELEKLK